MMNMNSKGKKKEKNKKKLHTTQIERCISYKHLSSAIWNLVRAGDEAELTEDEKNLLDLYRKITSLLNKLTHQKFLDVMKQIALLPINTKEKMFGFCNIIIQKAVNEPLFAALYAEMCYILQYAIDTHFPDSSTEQKFVDFKTILISTCLKDFNTYVAKHFKLKQMYDVWKFRMGSNSNKLKNVPLWLYEAENEIKRKFINYAKFIGELCVVTMIEEETVMRYVEQFLTDGDEKCLEYLCTLLAACGWFIEHKLGNKELDGCFEKIKQLSKQETYSLRIRFMLEDSIDLRSRNWRPRNSENVNYGLCYKPGNVRHLDKIANELDKMKPEEANWWL